MADNVLVAGNFDVTVDGGQRASCLVYFSTVYYVTYGKIQLIVFCMHSTRRISAGQLRGRRFCGCSTEYLSVYDLDVYSRVWIGDVLVFLSFSSKVKMHCDVE
jgi:hypothetical protein